MKFNLKTIIEYLFYLFLSLLPWHCTWIFKEQFLGGVKWQYGSMLLYGTELLLWGIILLFFIQLVKERKFRISNLEFRNIDKKKLIIISSILFLALWSGLSILWSSNHELSLYLWVKLLQGLVFLVLILNLKFSFKKFAWAIVISGVVQSILGMVQFWSQAVIGNKWLGISPHIPSDAGAFVIEYDAFRWIRAYGSFTHPNILAGFLTLGFFLSLFLYFKYKPGWLKILSSVSTIIIASGLFFSFSRSAWLSCAVVYILLVIILFLKKKFLDTAKITIYLIIILSFFIFIYQPLVMTRLGFSERLELKSVDQRIDSISEAQELIGDNWLLGVGVGGYTYALYQKEPNLPAWDYQPVHNLYLLVWSELGLIGLLAYLLISLFALFLAFKNNNIYYLILIAFLLIGLFDHYFWTSYVGIMMWWLVVGMGLKNS